MLGIYQWIKHSPDAQYAYSISSGGKLWQYRLLSAPWHQNHRLCVLEERAESTLILLRRLRVSFPGVVVSKAQMKDQERDKELAEGGLLRQRLRVLGILSMRSHLAGPEKKEGKVRSVESWVKKILKRMCAPWRGVWISLHFTLGVLRRNGCSGKTRWGWCSNGNMRLRKSERKYKVVQFHVFQRGNTDKTSDWMRKIKN